MLTASSRRARCSRCRRTTAARPWRPGTLVAATAPRSGQRPWPLRPGFQSCAIVPVGGRLCLGYILLLLLEYRLAKVSSHVLFTCALQDLVSLPSVGDHSMGRVW